MKNKAEDPIRHLVVLSPLAIRVKHAVDCINAIEEQRPPTGGPSLARDGGDQPPMHPEVGEHPPEKLWDCFWITRAWDHQGLERCILGSSGKHRQVRRPQPPK